MDVLTLFGATVAAAMVTTYALERRHHLFTLAFALMCLLSAVYAFLIDAWVFGVLELLWYLIAMRRWMARPERGNAPVAPPADPSRADRRLWLERK